MTLAEFKLAVQTEPQKSQRRTQAHTNLVEACLTVCKLHRHVAWAKHINSGAMKIDGRFVRFGFPGCSDILGQLVTGHLLAIEAKVRPDKTTEEQQAFLETVRDNGALAVIAYSHEDVTFALERYFQGLAEHAPGAR